jgi:hypothetical protein
MAAHAIRHDRQGNPASACMRKDRDAILLFLAIPLMLCRTGIDCYRHPSSFAAGRLSRKGNGRLNTIGKETG